MLAIRFERPGEPPWRKTFAYPQVIVGSALTCNIVLGGPGIADQHAQIVGRGNQVFVVALNGAAVRVDGNAIRKATPRSIRPDSRILIAGYSLWASSMAAETVEDAPRVRIRAPEERALLDAIERGDRASRLVYADWLEARGDDLRAEYLRVQDTLFDAAGDDPTVGARGDRLRELAAAIGDLGWRSRVAMQQVEGCAFMVSCPREWDAMSPTDRDGVRHCSTCDRDVMYCATAEEARGWAARGACVALDITAPRWDDDLAPPFGTQMCAACEIDVGEGLHCCPRCGAYVGRVMMRGMIG